MKIRQDAEATFTLIAADKNLILVAGGVGFKSLKKVKIISGASMTVSTVKPTPNISDSQIVIPRTQLTNLFAPI